MGGRGRSSNYSIRRGVIKMPEGYTVVNNDMVRAREAYPFFEGVGRRWSLVSVPLEGEVTVAPRHTLGMDVPTLIWFSDNDRKELYMDGMSTEAFCQATGLQFSLHKGAAVLSKRMSRLLRSYRIWGWFEADQVRVGYLYQTPAEAKVWDGAGLIDRKMLAKLPAPEGMNDEEARAWRGRLMREGRVEFTLQHADGQDKGHALVVDQLRDEQGQRVDFLLPRDTKKEVTLADGVFVGINPVHGRDDLRVDIQSFINLNQFWGRENAIEGAQAELNLFEAAVATNTLEEIGLQLGGRDAGEGEAWPLQAFWEAGGDVRWSPHLIKAVFDQHLRRLDASSQDKVRLPQAGGRYYVLPVGVGRHGGLKLKVGRGEVHIDKERATAWVNDDDWLSLSGQQTQDYSDGIAAILGGADNDDGLWLAPFTDVQDGNKKFLTWRSPNQVGEYVVLTPTATSHIPEWHGVELWPERDSALLPTRSDKQTVQYMGMVNHEQVGDMGQGEAYSPEVMARVQGVLERNQGGLELYCNSTMRHVAMYGGLPKVAPARLEDVVDSKKTGADVSGVKAWCYEDTRAALAQGERIPRRLLARLARERTSEGDATQAEEEQVLQPPPLLTGQREGHWLDTFDREWTRHIQAVKQIRDNLMAEAQLPEAVIKNVLADADALSAGSKFNQIYATTVKRLQQQGYGANQKAMLAQVQEQVESELSTMTPTVQRARLVQLEFEQAWRKGARGRASGTLSPIDHAVAEAQARDYVARLSDRAVYAELRNRLTVRTERQLKQPRMRGLSLEAQEEVRATMEQYLSQWDEARGRAVLRGAMVSVMLNPQRKPNADADGVWLMGARRPDGTRAPGIANHTIAALEEVGVMGIGLDAVLREVLQVWG